MSKAVSSYFLETAIFIKGALSPVAIPDNKMTPLTLICFLLTFVNQFIFKQVESSHAQISPCLNLVCSF